MIEIIDGSMESFCKDLHGKKFFLFGAGRRAAILYQEMELEGRIIAVIDNDKRLWGTQLYLGAEKLPVIGVKTFLRQIDSMCLSDIRLLVTTTFYVWQIIQQLDEIKELDHLKCYIGDLLVEHYEKQLFSFSKGEPKIPKKIHYCWFGGKEIPLHLQRYMETWQEKCPDYEIIRWDESNYDITKNRYMKEAYACGKWGFVPDYARLDIIYQEGGVYLDTDIELFTSLDRLLCDDMFCCAINQISIAFGLGFGAVKGHPLIKQLRDYYHGRSFYNDDGSMNLMPCYVYQNPVLKEYGFEIKNKYQIRDGAVLYPSEVAAPTGSRGLENNYTQNTIMDHHSELSWISEEERKNMQDFNKYIKNRNYYRGGVIYLSERIWGYRGVCA